ncbi:hypothetical protein RJ55_05261 [Drechmeria coniospora]|nr:hypothetical protein RJ55_05261 [Drechmeria coniospora]
MSDKAASRFAPQNKSTHELLSTNTVGLVALSDFRKRRAEVLEQQEREAHEAAFSGTSTPDRSNTATPDNGSDSPFALPPGDKKKTKKKRAKKLLSFDDDDGGDGDGDGDKADAGTISSPAAAKESAAADGDAPRARIRPNAAAGMVPKAVMKSALRREAAEREALRREFAQVQETVKAAEVAIPFVFYDGANTPGGVVRMKKGDFVWVFLDKSRKVGAELGVGDQANAKRSWARVGVDDLMLVRDTIVIPHHYDFYFFIMNKSVGPGGRRLFDYSDEPPANAAPCATGMETDRLITPASKAAAAALLPAVSSLEGAGDDPSVTKVVDRRWYERNKHIYPASTWQEFDPEKDYSSEIRKDTGGNTFFFSK